VIYQKTASSFPVGRWTFVAAMQQNQRHPWPLRFGASPCRAWAGGGKPESGRGTPPIFSGCCVRCS